MEPIDKKFVRRIFRRTTRRNIFERYYITTPTADYWIHLRNGMANFCVVRPKDENGESAKDKVEDFVLLPEEIQNRFIFPNYPFL